MTVTPSFGTMIRAMRLGYGWSAKHQSFVRLSTPNDEENLVELAPHDNVPVSKTPGRYHRRWWEEPNILEMIPAMRMITKVKKPFSFMVDNKGEVITKGTS